MVYGLARSKGPFRSQLMEVSVNHPFRCRSLFSLFGLSLLSLSLLLPAYPQPPDHSGALPPVQVLDPELTAGGPVIGGLFGRFPWEARLRPFLQNSEIDLLSR
jgi:hypothetical protein